MLPFLRDAAVTFWNFAISKCNINVNRTGIEQGLEVIEIEGDVCSCLTGELKEYWSSSKDIFDCNNSVLDRLSTGSIRIEQDNIRLELGKLKGSRSNFSLSMLREMNRIIGDYLMYSYGRGFLFLNNRAFKKNEKFDYPKGQFKIFIDGFSHGLIIRAGMNIGRITKDIFLFTVDVIQEKDVIAEFFRSDYNELKNIVSRVMKTFGGKSNEYPIIHDILHERLLLEIVKKSLTSSISYALNWPSLRVYIRTKTSLTLIDIPSTAFDLAKAAVLRSAVNLGYSPSKLVKTVTQIIDNGLGTEHKVINQMYALASSILQGNPDVELLYNLERANLIESRS
jgi:hypothetical protein